MKKIIVLLIILAFSSCLCFMAFLLEANSFEDLLIKFSTLKKPESINELGSGFSILAAIFSSLALALGLLAVIYQVKHQSEANLINALAARHQYLISESERLEENIQSLKSSGKYDQKLFENMINKKKRLKESAEKINTKLEKLFNE